MIATRRVLQLVPSFGGGGAETQLAYLCAGLVQRDWHVDVLHLTGGPKLEHFRSSGAAIHTVPVRGNYDPSILWRLRQAIRDLLLCDAKTSPGGIVLDRRFWRRFIAKSTRACSARVAQECRERVEFVLGQVDLSEAKE